MNAIDKSASILGGATLIGQPSWADVIPAIEKADDLDLAEKRHLATSLRQMARYLGRPLTMIPTRIAAIGTAIKGLHPTRLGVNAKTFANHRSNVRKALLWFNRQTPGCGRKAPMEGRYRALWNKIENRFARDVLSPFFRFLSEYCVEPDGVRGSHLDAFNAYRRETSFGKVTLSQHRALVRHWNACADQIAGWPSVRLTEPAYPKGFTGPASARTASGTAVSRPKASN